MNLNRIYSVFNLILIWRIYGETRKKCMIGNY